MNLTLTIVVALGFIMYLGCSVIEGKVKAEALRKQNEMSLKQLDIANQIIELSHDINAIMEEINSIKEEIKQSKYMMQRIETETRKFNHLLGTKQAEKNNTEVEFRETNDKDIIITLD